MFENARLLERIERAQDERPYCIVCAEPTEVVERDGGLWLVCGGNRPTWLVGRLLHRLAGHHEALIVHPSEHAMLISMRRAQLRVVRS
jgi:hypothetical protein